MQTVSSTHLFLFYLASQTGGGSWMQPLRLAQHDKDGSQEGDGCLDADKLWAKPPRDWARTSEQLHVLAASILHVVALEVNQARLLETKGFKT